MRPSLRGQAERRTRTFLCPARAGRVFFLEAAPWRYAIRQGGVPMQSGLLLLGHGSRDPQGAHEFLRLVAAVAAAEPGRCVRGGVLEFAGPIAPSIEAAADEIVQSGARRIVGQPVLLFHAGHDKDDMPRQRLRMMERHPKVEFHLGSHLGHRQELIQLAHERAVAALATLGPAEGPNGLLLVARGTRHPDANGDMWKLARLFWECHGQDFPLVEAAFVSLAEPFVPEGIARLRALGAGRIVVVPYFLNTGVLVQRIGDQARRTADGLGGIPHAVADHLGVDRRLVAALCDEAARAERSPRPPQGLAP